MPISESDLPGVGKKYEIELENDEILVIVIHNTGKREVFLKTDTHADSQRLFDLSDQLARTVGTILEGAYFQPVETDDRATTLGEGTLIEWFDVAPDGELTGQTIADVLEDSRVTAAIVAVQHGSEVIPASSPDKSIQAGDTVVAVGTREDLAQFEALLVSERNEGDDPVDE